MPNFISRIFPKKVHIFYRHVHLIEVKHKKKRPDWFSFRACFLNLIDSLEKSKSNIKFDLTIMFDGSEKEYREDFLSKFLDSYNHRISIKLVMFKGGSDGKSFHTTLDTILGEKYGPNDWIYLLENDYLHSNDWTEKLDYLLDSQIPFDYISLYDHQDKYEFTPRFHPFNEGLTSAIYVTNNHHWRTAPSTCASFIVSFKTLKEDSEIIRVSGMDHEFFDVLINHKGRRLITPVPGLSTHVMPDLMSPTINWERISKSYDG